MIIKNKGNGFGRIFDCKDHTIPRVYLVCNRYREYVNVVTELFLRVS